MTESATLTTDPTEAELMEQVVVTGDLAALAPAQRAVYYNQVCKSLGLNPLTKPFEYIKLDGRLTLYAKRDATEQLRRIYGVSVSIVDRRPEGSVFYVLARATTTDNRTDESIGAVSTIYPDTIEEWQNGQRVTRPHPQAGKPLVGDDLANALMKAETKAKRRVTLSIVGLGWLDETEIETVRDVTTVRVDTQTGEIMPPSQPPAPVITQATPVTQAPPQLPEGVHKALHAAGQSFYGSQWDAKRHELVAAITKGRTESSNGLTVDEATRLIDGIHRAADKAAAAQVDEPEPF